MTKRKNIALHDYPDLMETLRETVFKIDGLKEAGDELQKQREALTGQLKQLTAEADRIKDRMIKAVSEKFDIPKSEEFKIDLDYLEQFNLAFVMFANNAEGASRRRSRPQQSPVLVGSGSLTDLHEFIENMLNENNDESNDDDGSGNKFNH